MLSLPPISQMTSLSSMTYIALRAAMPGLVPGVSPTSMLDASRGMSSLPGMPTVLPVVSSMRLPPTMAMWFSCMKALDAPRLKMSLMGSTVVVTDPSAAMSILSIVSRYSVVVVILPLTSLVTLE